MTSYAWSYCHVRTKPEAQEPPEQQPQTVSLRFFFVSDYCNFKHKLLMVEVVVLEIENFCLFIEDENKHNL